MDPAPKVYFLACAFPPIGRGNSITNACVANCLADYFSVDVICMDGAEGFLLSYQEDQSLAASLHQDLVVKRVRAAKWGGLNEVLYGVGLLPCYYLNWAWSVWKKRRQLFAERGVIFAVYPVFSDLLLGYFLSRRFGYPLLVDFRDDFSGVMSRGWRRLLRGFYRRLEARILQQAAGVTVTTAALKSDLVQRHGLDEGKVGVVYNVVPEAAAPVGKPADKGVLKLIYAGALSRIQRPEILLQACALLEREQKALKERLQVEIYGPDNRYFRRQVRPHLLEGTRFGGFLPRRELEAQLAGADIGFLSLGDATYAYATPTKLFDYIELGLPIVAALPSGAAQAMIEEHEIGLVAALGDVDGLAHCIARMIEDAALRNRCRKNMLQLREQFRPARQVPKWRDILLQLMEEKPFLPVAGHPSSTALQPTGAIFATSEKHR